MFDIDEYLQLLDLTYQVVQSLQGKPAPDPRWTDCQRLTAKLFFHAATVYHLRQGTKAPLYSTENGANFYDFASVTIIIRTAFETYLRLFEVFFEPTNDDEFEFRHALWQLAGFIIRENFIPSDPSLRNQLGNAQEEIHEMRTRIRETETFKTLTDGQQKQVLKGRRVRAWRDVAKAAGFGEQTIRQMYAYYSGYVHSDALSAVQVIDAKTANEQIEYIDSHMRTLMIVMSKMIVDYANKFPETREVCDKNPQVFYQAEVLTQAIKRLP